MNPLTLQMTDKRTVDLPHDYCIEQKMDPMTAATASNAYLPGGVIEYEKSIFVPADWQSKKIMLEFEGVYMNATVRINQNIVCRHPYGYTSFHCDLTPYIRFGEENQICVHVNNSALPNSRWYSGMGIYRHVYLMVGERVHIEPWGVHVTAAAGEFTVQTKILALSDAEETVTVRQSLFNEANERLAQTEKDILLRGKKSVEETQSITAANLKAWDVDAPHLYRILTEIICDGKVMDSCETKTGIRSIAFEAKKGFLLNGRPLKLKGGCVHHDCGILGAAAHDRAEWRKAEILKKNGYNAVRCAHNPPSPAFLDACDALGLLVIDEAFDCWNEPKMTNDYSIFFPYCWKEDLASMILRDRNHPSIILWSIGNEIPERDGRSDGYRVAKTLATYARSLDNTRAVTNALCGLVGNGDWAKLTAPFAEDLDVVGYNYLLDRYDGDGEIFPDRLICGTETYPMQAFDYWEAVEKNPHVIGDFVWTALDYLGEAGIGRIRESQDEMFVGSYPWSHANCGDIDLCGFKRPQSYYRDCVWGISKKPYIAVHDPAYFGQNREITPWGWPEVSDQWNWPGFEAKPIQVDIYCADDEVELFVNGRSLGRKETGRKNKYFARYTLSYEPGEISCVSYRKNEEIARQVLVTPGEPCQIEAIADRDRVCVRDLCYITVNAVDQDGRIANHAAQTLHISASGAGKILAVGSANPKSDEKYVGNLRRFYHGSVMAIVEATGVGEIEITAAAEGLKSAKIILHSNRE